MREVKQRLREETERIVKEKRGRLLVSREVNMDFMWWPLHMSLLPHASPRLMRRMDRGGCTEYIKCTGIVWMVTDFNSIFCMIGDFVALGSETNSM